MIIVLKNADFSEKNLGQIDFNTPLSSETLGILDIATKYPKDKENAYTQALNRFINGLVDADIYSKISLLVFPVMSQTIQECSYNQKTGAANSNPTFFSQLYGLRSDNTLYRTSTVFGDTTTHCAHTINLEYNNCCLFGYYKAGTEFTDIMLCGEVNGWYGASNYIQFAREGGTYIGRVSCGAVGVMSNGQALLNLQKAITTPFIANYGEGIGTYKDKRFIKQGTYSNPTKTDALVKLYPLLFGPTSTESDGSLLMYGCGAKLTDAEINTLYRLMDEFGSHFI